MNTETPQTDNEAAGGQSRAGEAGANLTNVLGAEWVCPWGICNHEQAQTCRAEKRFSRLTQVYKGCGGRFPRGTTPGEAKQIIGPCKAPNNQVQAGTEAGEACCSGSPGTQG